MRYVRFEDGYIYPSPKELRPATSADLAVIGVGEGLEEQEAPSKVGTLESPTDHYDWNRLVLYPEAVQSIRSAVNSIQNRALLEEAFHISSIDPSSKCLINFYGAPGTGKTMAAKAVARELGKPLLQADYSQITSKWVGETSKGIKTLFQEAQTQNAVLFLDEADSLAGRRLDSPSDSAGLHFNQEKNVFMQELDKFQGIVIMTTNLFSNYDPALTRRIAEHVKFELPSFEMREQIIRQYFVKCVKIQVSYSNVAKCTEGFSGGDLLNVAKNSVKLAALQGKDPSKWLIDDKIVNTVVRQIRESKQVTGDVGTKKPMGFSA